MQLQWIPPAPPEQRACGGSRAHPTESPVSLQPVSFSAGAHCTETAVAFAYYNVGIQNAEVLSQTTKWHGEVKRLEDDIQAAFNSEHGLEVLLLSEFGNMYDAIDVVFRTLRKSGGGFPPARDAQEFFEHLLQRVDLGHITVHANVPYVSLVDGQTWYVASCDTLYKVCTHRQNFAQHLLLRHVDETNFLLRLFNAHVPRPHGTQKRKEDTVKKMCRLALEGRSEDPSWVIGGDSNAPIAAFVMWCAFARPPGPLEDCFSDTGVPTAHNKEKANAQKADFAFSQGIASRHIPSWVGDAFPPCASDVHNMVFVAGLVRTSANSTDSNFPCWLPLILASPPLPLIPCPSPPVFPWFCLSLVAASPPCPPPPRPRLESRLASISSCCYLATVSPCQDKVAPRGCGGGATLQG